ncbi:MAG TPA: hypothetical protein V6C58_03365, partial [Allocoleopsis sp.]
MIELKGFENRYKIDEYGNVYSLLSNKMLSKSISKQGYIVYNLTPTNIRPQITATAHSLVYKNFISET